MLPSVVETKSMEKRRNIKVLSLGIDRYAHESIPNLGGAVSDARKLRQFFTESLQIPPENYVALYDEAATRTAIIANFRAHFGNLTAGDIAVLHFSGHGSWEPCSDAFIEADLDPEGGRNEVLVCHDSRVDESLPIADKELRLLVAEAEQDSKGDLIEDLHFVCLFDCCHSGSMLRQGTGNVRNRLCRDSNQQRALGDYLEGQYQQMETLHIPPANFILLAACSPSESALEDDNGGFFTNALLAQLEVANTQNRFPSYAELFPILRERIFQQSHTSQTPHLEPVGKVNPYDTFLGLPGNSATPYPAIVRQDDKWKVNRGAIHGVVYDDVCHQALPIFRTTDMHQAIGWCSVASVELEYTLIQDIRFEGSAITPDSDSDQILSQSHQEFRVGLSGRPLPIRIDRRTEEKRATELLEGLQASSFLLLTDAARYSLIITDDVVQLLGPNQERLIAIKDYSKNTTDSILQFLFQISRWETIKLLTNNKSSRIKPEKITLSFEFRDSNGMIQSIDKSQPDQDHEVIEVEYDPVHGPILYSIKMTHFNSRRLYCYLLHLDRKFGMKQKHENYTKYILLGEDIYLYQSITDRIGLGIGDDHTNEIEDTFVLVAGLQPLSVPYAFEQAGLGKHFQKTIDAATLDGSGTNTREDLSIGVWNETEWVTRKIRVRTIRKRP